MGGKGQNATYVEPLTKGQFYGALAINNLVFIVGQVVVLYVFANYFANTSGGWLDGTVIYWYVGYAVLYAAWTVFRSRKLISFEGRASYAFGSSVVMYLLLLPLALDFFMDHRYYANMMFVVLLALGTLLATYLLRPGAQRS